MNLLYTYPETIVDGEGIRYSIYLAGCNHGCKGCHNKQSWDPKAGKEFTEELLDTIIKEINNNPLLDGITLSGGDPFFKPKELLPLVKRLKEETHQNIWCYTGFLYEKLLESELCREILSYIDVLVDGPFIQDLYSPTISFRGSSNQRIIYLDKTIK